MSGMFSGWRRVAHEVAADLQLLARLGLPGAVGAICFLGVLRLVGLFVEVPGLAGQLPWQALLPLYVAGMLQLAAGVCAMVRPALAPVWLAGVLVLHLWLPESLATVHALLAHAGVRMGMLLSLPLCLINLALALLLWWVKRRPACAALADAGPLSP